LVLDAPGKLAGPENTGGHLGEARFVTIVTPLLRRPSHPRERECATVEALWLNQSRKPTALKIR
jgi:hypothetical protein